MGDDPDRARAVDVEWLDDSRLGWVSRAAWLAALPAPIAVLIAWLDPSLFGIGVVGLGWASWLMPVALVLLALPKLLRARIGGEATAQVDAETGLTIERGSRSVRIAPERLALAWAHEPTRVEVLLHDGELHTTLADEREAAALVAAIRRVTGDGPAYPVGLETPGLRLVRQSLGAWGPSAVATAALLFGPVGLVAVPLALVAAVALARGTPRLRFGADGVEVCGRLRRRYVPYRAIRSVRVRATLLGRRAIDLELDRGGRITLGRLVERSRAWLVRALIEEGLQMLSDGEAAGARVPSLDRASDEPEAWRARVAGIGQTSDYRGPALDAERLWLLMRNPAADPEQRVGAALALRDRPAGLRRIRVAAEVSAEPDVRAALEALGEEELEAEALERALGRLDRAGRAARRA